MVNPLITDDFLKSTDIQQSLAASGTMEKNLQHLGSFDNSKDSFRFIQYFGGNVVKKINWPSEETLKRMDKKLSRAKGSRVLPPDADPVGHIKYNLCKAVVIYCQEHNLSQRDLAKLLDVSESRVSQMVHYRIEKLTIDRLVKHLTRLKQTVKIQVA